MRPADEGGPTAFLTADTILGQIEAAVLVTDRLGNLRYANSYAAGLFGLPGDAGGLAGLSVLSLMDGEAEPGPDGDPGTAAGLVQQVLAGGAWEGALASPRPDGSRVAIEAQAVPYAIRPARSTGSWSSPAGPPGARPARARPDRAAGTDRRAPGRLARAQRHAAARGRDAHPQFADHCFIDLLDGDKLIRRAQSNARGWTPPPGSWAQVGEQVYYPEGHFCQQAMAQLDAVVVPDLRDRRFPAPNARSLRAREDVGVVSAAAAPLCARGELLGVMSLGLSRLSGPGSATMTPRPRLHGGDRRRVAIAIDNAMLFEDRTLEQMNLNEEPAAGVHRPPSRDPAQRGIPYSHRRRMGRLPRPLRKGGLDRHLRPRIRLAMRPRTRVADVGTAGPGTASSVTSAPGVALRLAGGFGECRLKRGRGLRSAPLDRGRRMRSPGPWRLGSPVRPGSGADAAGQGGCGSGSCGTALRAGPLHDHYRDVRRRARPCWGWSRCRTTATCPCPCSVPAGARPQRDFTVSGLGLGRLPPAGLATRPFQLRLVSVLIRERFGPCGGVPHARPPRGGDDDVIWRRITLPVGKTRRSRVGSVPPTRMNRGPTVMRPRSPRGIARPELASRLVLLTRFSVAGSAAARG